MKRWTAPVLFLAAGFSALSYLARGGHLPDSTWTLVLVAGLASLTLGLVLLVIDLRRPARRRGGTPRRTGQLGDLVGAFGPPALVVLVICAPIFIQSVPGGILMSLWGLVTLLLFARWHLRHALRRGVPRAERWRRGHERTFELTLSAESAFDAAAAALRDSTGVEPVRLGNYSLSVRTPNRRWQSGTSISVEVERISDSRCTVTAVAEPARGALLDGGAGWEAVAVLERALRQSATDA